MHRSRLRAGRASVLPGMDAGRSSPSPDAMRVVVLTDERPGSVGIAIAVREMGMQTRTVNDPARLHPIASAWKADAVVIDADCFPGSQQMRFYLYICRKMLDTAVVVVDGRFTPQQLRDQRPGSGFVDFVPSAWTSDRSLLKAALDQYRKPPSVAASLVRPSA